MEELELRTLRLLARSGTAHLRKLYKTLGMELEKLKSALSGLQEKGYVKSFAHGGYRFFSITNEGEQALKQPESEEAKGPEGSPTEAAREE